MTKAERAALRALGAKLGDDDDTWRASGRLVVMSDGDVVATCSGSLGAMPEPFEAEDAAAFIATARNSLGALLDALDALDDAEALVYAVHTWRLDVATRAAPGDEHFNDAKLLRAIVDYDVKKRSRQ